jgi:hypothetical protein
MKRIFLFLATNFAVLVPGQHRAERGAADVRHPPGPERQRRPAGDGAIFGFGGAFFSLAISKWDGQAQPPACS